MKYVIKDLFDSLFRLFRFIAWYAVVVVALIYLLPHLALFLEGHFDALSSSIKFFAVISFFAIVAAWQIADRRDRIRSSVTHRNSENSGDFHSA